MILKLDWGQSIPCGSNSWQWSEYISLTVNVVCSSRRFFLNFDLNVCSVKNFLNTIIPFIRTATYEYTEFFCLLIKSEFAAGTFCKNSQFCLAILLNAIYDAISKSLCLKVQLFTYRILFYYCSYNINN